MNSIAIIPARSGSKGLKNKNIMELNGRPLIAYSIQAAIESGLFKTVMLSTDSEEYAVIGRQFQAEVPFLRTKETSDDHAGSWEVVLEVLEEYRRNGIVFDTVCLLQPTSPLRTTEDIIAAYELLERKHADAITSVCECEYPMDYVLRLDKSLTMKEFRNKTRSVPRQEMIKHYRLNGAIYIRTIKIERDHIVLLMERELAYIMPVCRSVDIDTIEDFMYAEFLKCKKGI